MQQWNRILPSPAARRPNRLQPASSAFLRPLQPKEEYYYMLTPADTLPTVDLSISIKSHYFRPAVLKLVNLTIHQRRLLFVSFTISILLSLVIFFVSAPVGRCLAIVAFVLGIPMTLGGFLLLRYHVVCLLVQTYDFWFFSIVNCVLFGLIMQMFHDLRAIAMLQHWLGIQTNILIDANLRAVRRFAYISLISIFGSMVVILAITLHPMDQADTTFPIFAYDGHVLPANVVAASGIMTMMTVMGRNIYRKRNVFWVSRRNHRSTKIECVSYRCTLKFQLMKIQRPSKPTTRPSKPPTPSIKLASPAMQASKPSKPTTKACNPPESTSQPSTIAVKLSQVPEAQPIYMQPMHYVQRQQLINGAHTMTNLSHYFSQIPALFHLLGLTSMGLSAIGLLIDVRHDQNEEVAAILHDPTNFPMASCVALVLSLVYYALSIAMYQREMLLALLTSFDFLFMALQVTLVHVLVCDFFWWTPRVVVTVVLSWLWFHWVLCLDAFTPFIRQRLQFHHRMAVPVFLMTIGFGVFVVYLLVFSPTYSRVIQDRVVYKLHVFGTAMEMRTVPMFYNCLVTVMAWSFRLLSRLIKSDNDVLIVLDGAMEYENYFYLPQTTDRQSRSRYTERKHRTTGPIN